MSPDPSHAELRKWEMEWEAKLEQYKSDLRHVVDFKIESHKSTIAFAAMTVKSLFLVHGGAIVAINAAPNACLTSVAERVSMFSHNI